METGRVREERESLLQGRNPMAGEIKPKWLRQDGPDLPCPVLCLRSTSCGWCCDSSAVQERAQTMGRDQINETHQFDQNVPFQRSYGSVSSGQPSSLETNVHWVYVPLAIENHGPKEQCETPAHTEAKRSSCTAARAQMCQSNRMATTLA